ncbi:DnaJ subfamily C member 11, partial [Paragonimus westermani]
MTTGNLLDENDPLLDDAYKDDALNDTDDPPDPSFVHLLDSMEETESTDLYAVLGVSKTATPTEIRAAYKRLSLLLHPDRHTSGTSTGDNRTTAMQTITANAEAAFGRVSAAYNVLSDPEKRTIYDIYGHDGLQLQGWEVVSCEKSAPELRLEYLMLKQKALAEKQLQLTQPTSEFSVGLDLTDLFDRYY